MLVVNDMVNVMAAYQEGTPSCTVYRTLAQQAGMPP